MIRAIGIDVGGSGVKLGLVEQTGNIVAMRYIPVDKNISASSLADRIVAACLPMLAEGRVAGLGIAMPGFADRTGKIVDGGNNLPCLMQQSLPSTLSAKLGHFVLFENDGLAAVLGEMRFGAARHATNFAMLTLGTGIGGGIVTSGRLVRGRNGEPPELGAMVLDLDGQPNYSGLPGTLEGLAGKDGFLASFHAHGREGNDLLAHLGAIDTDPAAAAAFEDVARRIAQACGILVNTLNLDLCLLGGGISGLGERLLQVVRAGMARTTWPLLLERTELRLAERGNDAGLLGAASLFLFPQTPQVNE